jgi:hypothetical protein
MDISPSETNIQAEVKTFPVSYGTQLHYLFHKDFPRNLILNYRNPVINILKPSGNFTYHQL